MVSLPVDMVRWTLVSVAVLTAAMTVWWLLRQWAASKALRDRRTSVWIPTRTFDPSREEILRTAAALRRSRLATFWNRGFAVPERHAVRLWFGSTSTGEAAMAVTSVAQVRNTGYAGVETVDVDELDITLNRGGGGGGSSSPSHSGVGGRGSSSPLEEEEGEVWLS